MSPNPQAILDHAQKSGIKAQIIGEIIKEPVIKIISQGVQKTGETLVFT